jgi:CDP-diglyceride synthetase
LGLGRFLIPFSVLIFVVSFLLLYPNLKLRQKPLLRLLIVLPLFGVILWFSGSDMAQRMPDWIFLLVILAAMVIAQVFRARRRSVGTGR